ncbi:response regulator transcription factor [Haliangium sp.]|uniref:response regulator transcription factor n=1 Tax=Haliangium sp. TaxID=2663208 RepID=UPI003D0CDB89
MGSHDILIVEDDEAIATGLALNLKLAGHLATVVHDGESAMAHMKRCMPDLVLLDINLPVMNGLELVGALREAGIHIPIIMLSAREDETAKVAALRLGADDYVTKPFGLAELIARVEAVLRRTRFTPAQPAHVFGDVIVDPETRTVTRAGEEVKLTPLEFDLLSFLVQNPSRVLTRAELLRQVWKQSRGTLRTVDNFVAQLRSKLEGDPERPHHFVTVRGSGYRFDP